MRTHSKLDCLAWTVVVVAGYLFMTDDASGRPSMGRSGGGGARPGTGIACPLMNGRGR